MATIKIPRVMQKLMTTVTDVVDAQGKTAHECLQELAEQHPLLKPYLFDEQEKIAGFVGIYVDGVRCFSDDDVIGVDSVVEIIPAMSGG